MDHLNTGQVDEQARKEFERSWSIQDPTRIRQYLPGTEDHRFLATLEELVLIDLEMAWRTWSRDHDSPRPSPVEDYLAAHPQLNDEGILERLVRQEFRVRQAAGDTVKAQEYTKRFPSVCPSEEHLLQGLQHSTADPASTFGLNGGHSTFESGLERPGPGSATTAVGQQVGDFRIEQELGRGGMGVVYRAWDAQLARHVALKMILGGAHVGSQQLDRFLVEARAAAHLQHPNITQVFEIGEHQGLPFLALEFVEGPTLDKQLAGKPQPPAEAARIVEVIARAIQYAHERGILHRDLKPGNILVTRDNDLKISDFGLAKLLEEDAAATRTGTILGTPCYMSPEQARGAIREIGPASDQYSLGAMLYEMLTGRPPFLSADPVQTVMEVIHNEPVSPRQLQPTVPVDLDTICMKALQKEPAKRYESAEALAEDLRRFRAGEPIQARPVGRLERGWRWCRRNRLVASLSSALLLLLLTVSIVSSWSAIALARKNAEIERNSETISEQNRKILQQNEEITRESEHARQQERLAGERAEMAMTAYQTLISEVQETIEDTPQTKDLKVALLKAAAEGMERMSGEMAKTTAADPTLATALMKLADVLHDSGESEPARSLYRRVYDLVKPRPEIQNGSDASRFNVAKALWSLATMDEELQRDMGASRQHNLDALSILQDIHDHPRSGEGALPRWLAQYALASGHQRVGVSMMRLGNSAQALTHYRAALQIRQSLTERLQTDESLSKLPPASQLEIQQSVAMSQLAVGEALSHCQSQAEASPYFDAALQSLKTDLESDPDAIATKRLVANAAGMFADLLVRSGDLDKAAQHIELSCQLVQEVVAADPDITKYQRDLGVACLRRGLLLQVAEDPSAADWFRQCCEIRRRLAGLSEGNEKLQRELMVALAHTDESATAATMAREFVSKEDADNEVLLDVVRCLAQCSLRADSLQEAKATRDDAVRALQRAVANGFRDVVLLQHDPELRPLQSGGAFQQLLAEMPAASDSAMVE